MIRVYLENDEARLSNIARFNTKPLAIVIEDSFNNLAFPMKQPVLDNNKQNLSLIYKQYISQYYQNTQTSILPWHYVLEFIDNDYIIYNTRPIDLNYPYTTFEVKSLNNLIINNNTTDVLNSNLELKETIHVLIIGDSNRDVYTKQLYNKIYYYVVKPICKVNKIIPMMYNTVIPLNLGSRFLDNVLYNTFKST